MAWQIFAPARYIEYGAGHIGSLVRYQPNNGVGDFVGGANTLHRHHVAEPVGAVGLAAGSMNFGIDQPGPDRRDANAFAGDFVAQSDREGIDGAFGGGVIDIGIGRAELRGNRRQIDDDATLAAMSRRHPLYRFARAQNAAGDVDRHHALNPLGGHFVDARRRPHDAGVVDERAERSECVGRLEQREDVALVADIAFHRDRPAVTGFDRGDDAARGGLIAGIADADPKAPRRGGNRGGAADTSASAGDDDNPVCQICPHDSTTSIIYTRSNAWLAMPPSSQTSRCGTHHKSSTSRAGSSRLSLTRTRNVTASLPSMTR